MARTEDETSGVLTARRWKKNREKMNWERELLGARARLVLRGQWVGLVTAGRRTGWWQPTSSGHNSSMQRIGKCQLVRPQILTHPMVAKAMPTKPKPS